MALPLSPLPLVKKLTVSGIMGKTHGVTSASNPPSIPPKNKPNQLKPPSSGLRSSSPAGAMICVLLLPPVPNAKLNSSS